MMLLKKSFYWLFLLFLGCQPENGATTETPFTHFLDYGVYEVGFKTVFTADASRERVPYADWSGKLYPAKDTVNSRKLPLHIWYPANNTVQKLSYGYFVDLITKQTEKELLVVSDSLSKEIFIYQTNELKGENTFSSSQLDTLLGLKTFSSLKAPAVQKQFPLVIFPNGSSPANQSIMAEFLASHGYIVAGVPLKGEFSYVLDASTKGIETGVDDLQFALGQLLKLPNVDGNAIAFVANAIESSFCTALASRNRKIKALVSLDGGLLSQYEQRLLNKTNFYEPQNITLPLLAIYAPHPSISPHHIYGLKYSERYFAHFPEMSEFHFLNYGVFETFVPKIIGEPRGNTQKGFEAASELILAFLDARLKGKTNDLANLYSGKKNELFPSAIDTLFKREAFTPQPNMAILKNLFLEKGIPAIDSIYRLKVAKGDLQPFSRSFFNDFKDWLAWKKDPSYKNRKQLYEMAVESYPNSALYHYRLAYYLNETGDTKKSKQYYRLAKALLKTDRTLDLELRADLKEALDNAVNAL